jgi:hydrogenase maturation protein HypF
MPTFHLHFKGIVQGIGFRPFVYDLARRRNLKGWVKNSGKGLEIRITAEENEARKFYRFIAENAPPHSLITSKTFRKVKEENFKEFRIAGSSSDKSTQALLPPDIALCENCREEMRNPGNRRFGYVFTTCLTCGPRYSIIKKLPYDRPHTTMADLQMCAKCIQEYEEPGAYRQHSQTNSCPDCTIPMHLYNSKAEPVSHNPEEIINKCTEAINSGQIIAVKGIGGYLLMTDATNEQSIKTLRERKRRPAKPFAVMYPGLDMAKGDAVIRPCQEESLKGAESPVVLCEQKQNPASGLCGEAVAPGLGTVGVMIPYSPLFELLMAKIRRPAIATSANLSGSPIIYNDEQALKNLGNFSDFILTFDRDIVTPQDDSVVQFSSRGDRIILRRSRGVAPNYHPYPFKNIHDPILALGADLKGAFALADNQKLIVSQFLGNQESFDSQTAFRRTLEHIQTLYAFKPKKILADTHPGYHSRAMAERIAEDDKIELIAVQHHKAHFAAVLAEHGLQESEDILGFIWDGTGYGDDRQIWGGEVFLKRKKSIERIMHLDYFPMLAGDKMSLEPRLSAFSLLRDFPDAEPLLKMHFNEQEWNYYRKLAPSTEFLTSSMGRFLDAIGCLLGAGTHNTYEAEVAMKLENMARNSNEISPLFFEFQLDKDVINWKPFLSDVLHHLKKGKHPHEIAAGVFHSMASMIYKISDETGVNHLAFSGGVFQNAVLLDNLLKLKPDKTTLYFHKNLSPNDENIGFGQLAYFDMFDACR